jgi:hypothetical protein
VFANTANTPGLPGIATPTIPITITVNSGPIAQTPEPIIFGDAKVPGQTALPLAYPLGLGSAGPFNYTVGYVPNNTVGTALPPQYVSIVSGLTGSIPNGGSASIVVQVNPCPTANTCLPIGIYSGMLLASNNGQASGAIPQTTVPLVVYVGGSPVGTLGSTGPALGLMLPVNSPTIGTGAFPPATAGTPDTRGAYPLTIHVPAGYSPHTIGPNQLPRTTLFEVTGLDNTFSTAYQVAQPTLDPFTDNGAATVLPPGTITFDNAPVTCNTFAAQTNLASPDPGRTCFYSMEIDSTLLASGHTYSGFIRFSPVALTTAFRPLIVPINIVVTPFPEILITQPIVGPNPTTGAQQFITGIPLAPGGVVLTGTIGNSTLSCSVVDLSTTGGLVTNVTIAPITASWLSLAGPPATFSGVIPGVESPFGPIPGVPAGQFAAGPANVNTGLKTFQVCADPSKLVGVPAPYDYNLVVNGGGVGQQLIPIHFLPAGAPSVPGPLVKFSQIGIFRPPTPVGGALGFFTLDSNGNNAFDISTDKTRQFGLAGDIPVAGDWDGTGVIRLGVFRCPAVGVCGWYLDQNNNGTWDGTFGGDIFFQFGLPGDMPVVGDWNGDGKSKVGVMRCPVGPGTCTWYLDAGNERTPIGAHNLIRSYGIAGDQPAVGTWAGVVSGSAPVDQIGVYRGAGIWIVDSNGDGAFEPSDAQFSFGLAGDIPVVGNWNGNDSKRIGVFRPSTGQWILDVNGNGGFDVTDTVVNFGLPGDKPVVGFWTMP